MKRGYLLILLVAISLIISIQYASAAITLQKETITDIVPKELSQPAKFLVTVKNTGASEDYIEFYTFVDVLMSPKGAIKIDGGEEKEITLEIYPSAKLRNERTGSYTFVYYLKSQQQDPLENRLVIRILRLKDLIAMDMPAMLTLDSTEIEVSIENKEKIAFNDASVKLKSAFIDSSKQVSLAPLEKKNITFELNTEKLKNVLAGKYIAILSFAAKKEASFSIEKEIELREKSNIATTEKESGNIFYHILKITKTNEGNIISDVDIIIRKNIFANTFTTFSLVPAEIEKAVAFYTYKWHSTLKPGESLSVEITTNYFLPLGILFAIAIIAMLISLYFMSSLVIKKKALRIRSKTGEFALKITLHLKAKKDINNILLRDRVPHIAELHERYGTIKPTNFDKQRKLLEWNIPEMKKVEEHIFSYVIYSKVSILGSYHISNAFATFEINGKKKQASSNRVIFMSEDYVPV
jgi:hypothetical protein